jgi:hypothetical protein
MCRVDTASTVTYRPRGFALTEMVYWVLESSLSVKHMLARVLSVPYWIVNIADISPALWAIEVDAISSWGSVSPVYSSLAGLILPVICGTLAFRFYCNAKACRFARFNYQILRLCRKVGAVSRNALHVIVLSSVIFAMV